MAKSTKPMYFGIQGNINSKRLAKMFTQDQIEDFKLYGPRSDIGHYILDNLTVKYGNKTYITIGVKHVGKNKKGRCYDKTEGIYISDVRGKSSSSDKALGFDKEFLKELFSFLKVTCETIKEDL